jgi:U32 family peptidase
VSELLSPGGTMEMVREALEGGADSVYVGPLGWSRRESRFEFKHHEVSEAARRAHDHGAKLRVALNADLEPDSHDDMLRKLENYAAWGVDGLIMKTPEAMREVNARFPEITIHASVGCNIRSRAAMERIKDAGASQFVASVALNTFERIAALKRDADDVGIGVELLIHANRCVTGVGGCRLYNYFEPYFEEEVVHDSDGMTRVKLIGNPDKGGVCYRPCLGNHVPEIAERFPTPVLKYLEKSNNELYALLEDVPKYIDLGISTLKIQGREYPAPLIAELTKIYRRLIDQTKDGQADVVAARTDLDPILEQRNELRNEKTSQLHERLIEKMSTELHERLVSRMEQTETDWDPDAEEAQLLEAEALPSSDRLRWKRPV